MWAGYIRGSLYGYIQFVMLCHLIIKGEAQTSHLGHAGEVSFQKERVVQALLMLMAHFIFATLGKAQGKFNMMHLITIPITVPLKQINVFLLPIHWNFQVIKYHYQAYWKVSAQWKCEFWDFSNCFEIVTEAAQMYIVPM